MKTHKILLILLIVACLWFAHGCAVLKKAGWTGGGAAGGAAIGAGVGGPVGAGIGGGLGAIAGSTLSENDELRDGVLVGEGAAGKYIVKTVVVEKTPSWAWYMLGGVVLWIAVKIIGSERYRTLLFAALGRLFRFDFAGAVKNAAKAAGMAHSREISKIPGSEE